MAGRNPAGRKLVLFLFFVCAAAVVVGFWYVQSGGLEDEEEVADDEGVVDRGTDGGMPRRRPKKKKAADPKGKANDPHHPRSRAAHPPASLPPAGPGGTSYEAAIAGNNLKLAPGTSAAPDLTDTELAGPMRDGTFLGACGVPNSTHVTVKVAIRAGRAVGVSVYAAPPNPHIAGCVERHVRGLQWPSNAKMDSFVTTY